jgi:hypothetical protein
MPGCDHREPGYDHACRSTRLGPAPERRPDNRGWPEGHVKRQSSPAPSLNPRRRCHGVRPRVAARDRVPSTTRSRAPRAPGSPAAERPRNPRATKGQRRVCAVVAATGPAEPEPHRPGNEPVPSVQPEASRQSRSSKPGSRGNAWPDAVRHLRRRPARSGSRSRRGLRAQTARRSRNRGSRWATFRCRGDARRRCPGR